MLKSKYERKQPPWKNSRSPFYGLKFNYRNVILDSGFTVRMKTRGNYDADTSE